VVLRSRPYRLPGLPSRVPSPRVAGWTPSAEVVREGDDAVVRLEIPGVKAEDISVEIADGRLVVSGEKRDSRSEDTNGRTVREVRYGSFRRSFGLPARIGQDAVSATYDAGVLTVTVAGVHAGTSPVRIPVTAPAAASAVEGTEPASE
jgi:HSP20 family protein